MNKHKGNSLMKWWKTKFQNGYKHIDELSSNCRSDTETLRDEFLLTPSGTTVPSTEDDTEVFPGHQKIQPLVDEEVHCDLSVPANVPERREFAFTLYDFDRAGGVTKDDISGLVQAIFETLGSTLHQSSTGCRTIRVNLTLQPDKENQNGKSQSVDRNYDCPVIQQNDDEQDFALNSSLNSPKIRDESYSPFTRRRRKRKMSVRRQELLQIVRANMERNNLFYPPINDQQCGRKRRRKHHCRCFNDQTTPPTRRNKYHEDDSHPDAFHCDCCSKKPHTTPSSPHLGNHSQFNRSPITHHHSHHYQLSNKYDKRQLRLCDDQSNFMSKTVGNTPNLSRSRKKQLIQLKNSFINLDKSSYLENSSLKQSLNDDNAHHVHQHYHHHYHHPTSPVII